MFKRQPNPTFRGVAEIHDAGELLGIIDCEFHALSRKAFKAAMDAIGKNDKTEADVLAEMLVGWNHEAENSLVTVPYSRAVMDALCDEFWTAPGGLISAYVKAKNEAKQKNS